MPKTVMSEPDYEFEMHCEDLRVQAELLKEQAERDADAAHLAAFEFGKRVQAIENQQAQQENKKAEAPMRWRQRAFWILLGMAIALAAQALLNEWS